MEYEFIGLLVNQASRRGDGRRVWTQLQQVVTRYVDPAVGAPVVLDLLGEVPDDASVRDAVLRRTLLLQAYPGSPASQAIAALAARMRA